MLVDQAVTLRQELTQLSVGATADSRLLLALLFVFVVLKEALVGGFQGRFVKLATAKTFFWRSHLV